MNNRAQLALPDRPRELVALIQRRSLAFLPVWGALILVGFVGAGGADITSGRHLVPVIYVIGFATMFMVRRWHRRSYGEVRLTEPQRSRGQLAGVAMFIAFVVMTMLGPRAVPSPLPFTLAIIFAASLLWDPWRVSAHWLVLVGVLLWLSVIHVVGPETVARPWASSLLTGIAGALCSIVDHLLMVRLIRHPPGGMEMGVGHA